MATYTKEQLKKYFERIHLDLGNIPSRPLEQLALIQKHHLAYISFENVSLHYSFHRKVSIDPEDVYQKVVDEGRGGYCMEINTLLATVLRSLGFKLYSVGARVKHRMWTHVVNLVMLDNEKYMIDVGFGSKGPTKPLPLTAGLVEPRLASTRQSLRYRSLERHCDPDQRVWVYLHQDDESSDWEEMYSFVDIEFFAEDFEVSNWFTMTSPRSWFTQSIMVVRTVLDDKPEDPMGELIMWGNEVKRKRGKHVEVLMTMRSEGDRVTALDQYFGIKLDRSAQRAIRSTANELKG